MLASAFLVQLEEYEVLGKRSRPEEEVGPRRVRELSVMIRALMVQEMCSIVAYG